MDASDYSLFQKLLDLLCRRARSTRTKVNIVQVGANDGRINDPVYHLAKRYMDVTGLLLIEPQTDIIAVLSDNYKFHSDVTIWNGAIGSNGNQTFYRLNPLYYSVFNRRYLRDSPLYRVPTGFTSSSYDHVLQHVIGNLPDELSPEDAIESVFFQSAPISDVMLTVGWSERSVDILQVDAEGCDDEVLFASDLHGFQPVVINFEYRHLSRTRLVALSNYLEAAGFRLEIYDLSNAIAVNLKRAKFYGIDLI